MKQKKIRNSVKKLIKGLLLGILFLSSIVFAESLETRYKDFIKALQALNAALEKLPPTPPTYPDMPPSLPDRPGLAVPPAPPVAPPRPDEPPIVPPAPPVAPPIMPGRAQALSEGQIQALPVEAKKASNAELVRIFKSISEIELTQLEPMINRIITLLGSLVRAGNFKYAQDYSPQNLADDFKGFITLTLALQTGRDLNSQLMTILAGIEKGTLLDTLLEIIKPMILNDDQQISKALKTYLEILVLKIIAVQRKQLYVPRSFTPEEQKSSDEIFLKALSKSKGLTIDEEVNLSPRELRSMILTKLRRLAIHPQYLNFETIIQEGLPRKIKELVEERITPEELQEELRRRAEGRPVVQRPLTQNDSLFEVLVKRTNMYTSAQISDAFLKKYLFNLLLNKDQVLNLLTYPLTGKRFVIAAPPAEQDYRPLQEVIVSFDNKLDLLEFLDAFFRAFFERPRERIEVSWRKYKQPGVVYSAFIQSLRGQGRISDDEMKEIQSYIDEYINFGVSEIKKLAIQKKLKGLKDAKYKNITQLIDSLAPYDGQKTYIVLTPGQVNTINKFIFSLRPLYLERHYFTKELGKIVAIEEVAVALNHYFRQLRNAGFLTLQQVDTLKQLPLEISPKLYYIVKSVEAYDKIK